VSAPDGFAEYPLRAIGGHRIAVAGRTLGQAKTPRDDPVNHPLRQNINNASRAAPSTAASSVTSNRSGMKFAPNSLRRRSTSACLRTLPNTRNPQVSNSFAVAQPNPVDAPVITTDRMI
jgi:hypothetical protein